VNGAVGYYVIDTTKLTDDIHSITWSVTDSGGRVEGIGSRTFTVLNSGGTPAADALSTGMAADALRTQSGVRRSAAGEKGHPSSDGVLFRKGYATDAELEAAREEGEGCFGVEIGQAERLELHLPGEEGTRYTGYALIGDELRALPIGSKLEGNIFYWQPDASFLGAHELLFQRQRADGSLGQARVKIAIRQEGGLSAQTPAGPPGVR
jgi:hypothetical protein